MSQDNQHDMPKTTVEETTVAEPIEDELTETEDDLTEEELEEELTTNITITDTAQEYLENLLAQQDDDDIAVRIFVENAGTPRAECCMAYSFAEDRADGSQDDDMCLEYENFTAYIDGSSIFYLKDAVIDYNKDRFGGQLTFRAPNSKVPQVGEDATVEERIHYILQSDINPGLASHNGSVELVELIQEEGVGLTAVLKFGGGCQGCSAVDVTLRQGVEVQLKQQIPELTQVVDQTDHSKTDNAYYQ